MTAAAPRYMSPADLGMCKIASRPHVLTRCGRDIGRVYDRKTRDHVCFIFIVVLFTANVNVKRLAASHLEP